MLSPKTISALWDEAHGKSVANWPVNEWTIRFARLVAAAELELAATGGRRVSTTSGWSEPVVRTGSLRARAAACRKKAGE